MNIMKFFGFETDDDYDDYEEAQEEKRTRKSPAKRESTTRTQQTNSNAAGRLIVYNGIANDNDKRRLREAFINDGAMILIDMHTLTQREFDEEGKDFITFMGGLAFARNGEIKFIEPAQYLVTPRANMFEVWPEGSERSASDE